MSAPCPNSEVEHSSSVVLIHARALRTQATTAMHTSSTVPIATPAMMAAMVWSARSIGPIEDAPAEVAPERPPLQVAARERLAGLQRAGVEQLGPGRRDGCALAAEGRRHALGLRPLCNNLGASCFTEHRRRAAFYRAASIQYDDE